MKDLLRLPARGKDGIHVVVETPAGSQNKLKYLPALGEIGFSRPLPLGLHYPFDWAGIAEAEQLLRQAERLAGG